MGIFIFSYRRLIWIVDFQDQQSSSKDAYIISSDGRGSPVKGLRELVWDDVTLAMCHAMRGQQNGTGQGCLAESVVVRYGRLGVGLLVVWPGWSASRSYRPIQQLQFLFFFLLDRHLVGKRVGQRVD